MMRAGVEREALVVGMTLVPGFVSRNRSFALFEDPEVRARAPALGDAARDRAAAGGRATATSRGSPWSRAVDALRAALPGAVPAHRAARVAAADLELACVRYLAGRAGVPGCTRATTIGRGSTAALERLPAGPSTSRRSTRE